MGKMIDITGQKFGNLLVLSNAGKKDGKCYYWHCLCDCGKEIDVIGTSLRNGNTKSCGCQKYSGLKKYNLEQSETHFIPLGTKFGKLTVIEDLGFKPAYTGSLKNRRWYKCLCDCGNDCEASGNQLTQNSKLSCGKCLISKGEEKIKQILIDNNCIFNQEVIFPQLLNQSGKRLRFDFVVYNLDGSINRIIEFDGRQHYSGPEAIWSKGQNLQQIQEYDNIKNNFCKNNNIKILRIPYWELNNITYEKIFSEDYVI